MELEHKAYMPVSDLIEACLIHLIDIAIVEKYRTPRWWLQC
ncbi:unnamed protein product, partial [marine sediment metagenome]